MSFYQNDNLLNSSDFSDEDVKSHVSETPVVLYSALCAAFLGVVTVLGGLFYFTNQKNKDVTATGNVPINNSAPIAARGGNNYMESEPNSGPLEVGTQLTKEKTMDDHAAKETSAGDVNEEGADKENKCNGVTSGTESGAFARSLVNNRVAQGAALFGGAVLAGLAAKGVANKLSEKDNNGGLFGGLFGSRSSEKAIDSAQPAGEAGVTTSGSVTVAAPIDAGNATKTLVPVATSAESSDAKAQAGWSTGQKATAAAGLLTMAVADGVWEAPNPVGFDKPGVVKGLKFAGSKAYEYGQGLFDRLNAGEGVANDNGDTAAAADAGGNQFPTSEQAQVRQQELERQSDSESQRMADLKQAWAAEAEAALAATADSDDVYAVTEKNVNRPWLQTEITLYFKFESDERSQWFTIETPSLRKEDFGVKLNFDGMRFEKNDIASLKGNLHFSTYSNIMREVTIYRPRNLQNVMRQIAELPTTRTFKANVHFQGRDFEV